MAMRWTRWIVAWAAILSLAACGPDSVRAPTAIDDDVMRDIALDHVTTSLDQLDLLALYATPATTDLDVTTAITEALRSAEHAGRIVTQRVDDCTMVWSGDQTDDDGDGFPVRAVLMVNCPAGGTSGCATSDMVITLEDNDDAVAAIDYTMTVESSCMQGPGLGTVARDVRMAISYSVDGRRHTVQSEYERTLDYGTRTDVVSGDAHYVLTPDDEAAPLQSGTLSIDANSYRKTLGFEYASSAWTPSGSLRYDQDCKFFESGMLRLWESTTDTYSDVEFMCHDYLQTF